MEKLLKCIALGVFILLIGCHKTDETDNIEESLDPTNNSFLPMHLGNYWKYDEQNYTEIIDSLRIGVDLYYKFYSIVGGDATSIQYLRIDDDQNLIESFPDNPDFKYIHAKFNASLGDTFWTINDQSVNDFKASLIGKENTLRTFEFQRIYHPNAKDKHQVNYIRGLGWDNGWLYWNNPYNEIKIDGDIFNF